MLVTHFECAEGPEGAFMVTRWMSGDVVLWESAPPGHIAALIYDDPYRRV
jgi:hypothetical protein